MERTERCHAIRDRIVIEIRDFGLSERLQMDVNFNLSLEGAEPVHGVYPT